MENYNLSDALYGSVCASPFNRPSCLSKLPILPI